MFFLKRDNEFLPLEMILLSEQKGVFPPQNRENGLPGDTNFNQLKPQRS